MSGDLEQRVAEVRELLAPLVSWPGLEVTPEMVMSGRYSVNDARFHRVVREVMRVLDVEGGEQQ